MGLASVMGLQTVVLEWHKIRFTFDSPWGLLQCQYPKKTASVFNCRSVLETQWYFFFFHLNTFNGGSPGTPSNRTEIYTLWSHFDRHTAIPRIDHTDYCESVIKVELKRQGERREEKKTKREVVERRKMNEEKKNTRLSIRNMSWISFEKSKNECGTWKYKRRR